MKSKYMIPGLLIFLFACASLKPVQPVNQWIEGHIYLLQGNQMPSPGRPVSKGRGVSRDIYIYEPTTINQTEGASPMFNKIKTKLIAHTKSDSTGHYRVNLPIGKYTVFIKENNQYFAAESDGSGALNPVEISANTITQKDFKLTNNAAF